MSSRDFRKSTVSTVVRVPSDDPGDKQSGGKMIPGNYLWRLVKVEMLRRGEVLRSSSKVEWMFVVHKQIVACLSENCVGKVGETYTEKYSSAIGDAGYSFVKGIMGNLCGFTDAEELNDEMGRDDVDPYEYTADRENDFARDVLFEQEITYGEYTTKAGKVYEDKPRRFFHSVWSKEEVENSLEDDQFAAVERCLPNGFREDQGLEPHEVLDRFVADQEEPKEPAKKSSKSTVRRTVKRG